MFSIAAIFVLGVGAQWIAWRYRLPSILLLLAFGFLAGPVTGLLEASMLSGGWVLTFVALSVGIILFEGGLSLRLDELREVGGAVGRLISLGVLCTCLLASAAAWWLLDIHIGVALIIGAIMTVTGPTVIIPLLRHIHPKGRVGTIAKWEGITIDPIGAILAVLVLEVVLLMHEPAGTFEGVVKHTLRGLSLQFVVGLGVGIGGAGVLVLLLRRHMVPDYLQNSAALMVVIAVFSIADALQHESGLVATTVMGFAVANQRYVAIRRIEEFKKDLRVLLIATLFIVLAARLDLGDMQQYIGWKAIVFLLVLMLIVRPISVYVSTLGTRLDIKEKAFLSWLAPRGIVAAAVASLFAFRLEDAYPDASQAIVPIVFLVIIGTVAIYGLTISPVAGWLGLAEPNPQGVLFVGAHSWARTIAGALDRAGCQVLMVDTNPNNVTYAQEAGLPATRGNVLVETILDALDLSGLGRLVVMTPNDEVNSLAVVQFTQVFDSAEIYQLSARQRQSGKEGKQKLAQHLRGRPLFGTGTNYASLSDRFEVGAEVVTLTITEERTYADVRKEFEGRMTPLFVVREKNQLHVFSQDDDFLKPDVGHVLIALVDPPSTGGASSDAEDSLDESPS